MSVQHLVRITALSLLVVTRLAAAAPAAPTAQEAETFVADAEKRLDEVAVEAGRAAWVQANFITEDTVLLSAKAAERATTIAVELAKAAARFDGVAVSPEVARKLLFLKLGITLPAPSDPAKTTALTQTAANMEAKYGAAKYCPAGKTGEDCYDLGELSQTIAESRDPAALLDAWKGWHDAARPLRADYQRYVALGNEGARELGFPDVGALWRSGYDMQPDAFAAEVDRLWGQVRPLYDQLHCYVRTRLAETYGASVVPSSGPIPAHLLGNMWAQDWSNIYPLVAPPASDPGYNLTERLVAKGTDAIGMVKIGEKFFTSLGFEPLPDTFWQRSLFVKPRDREVVCHASAWDLDNQDDLRLKMCIVVNEEDFSTVHHELGHNFYQRAYKTLPPLFRNSANDGFHEAVGDAVALSVTPEYLKTIGLIEQVPPASSDLGLLMQRALDKVAFLPFGLLIDQWRWQVFSGKVPPEKYNQAWWDLKKKYQGVVPPVARTEDDFDPGAKYHVPGGTPYTRYFLAAILQFQFHRAMCQAAGVEGPLHRCSIYGNQAAGEKLQAMLEMGASRPWPEALEALTGSPEMDATAILDYFKPLSAWLEQQNRGKTCGW